MTRAKFTLGHCFPHVSAGPDYKLVQTSDLVKLDDSRVLKVQIVPKYLLYYYVIYQEIKHSREKKNVFRYFIKIMQLFIISNSSHNKFIHHVIISTFISSGNYLVYESLLVFSSLFFSTMTRVHGKKCSVFSYALFHRREREGHWIAQD